MDRSNEPLVACPFCRAHKRASEQRCPHCGYDGPPAAVSAADVDAEPQTVYGPVPFNLYDTAPLPAPVYGPPASALNERDVRAAASLPVEWYYAEGRTQRGPVTQGELMIALRAQPQPRRVYVWREGMAEWQRAGDVPEIAPQLTALDAPPPPAAPPPAPPVPPVPVQQTYQPPAAASPSPHPARAQTPAPAPQSPYGPSFGSKPLQPMTDQVRAVAQLYGRLVKLVAIQIGLNVLSRILFGAGNGGTFLAVLVFIASIVLLVMTIMTMYRLTTRMGLNAPVIWAASMIIPFVNLIMLVIVSLKAQAWCADHGVQMGFLGPKSSNL